MNKALEGNDLDVSVAVFLVSKEAHLVVGPFEIVVDQAALFELWGDVGQDIAKSWNVL